MIVATGLLVPAFGAALAAGEAARGAQGSTAVKSVWQGVFTDAQIDRGKQEYKPACAQCHSEDLLGGVGPSLTGQAFLDRWNGSTVNDLVQAVRRTMPQEAPDSLSLDAYVDIAAYMLATAGAPAGAAELAADPDELKQVAITNRR
jgi:mono/diheme cytochrome c family protein